MCTQGWLLGSQLGELAIAFSDVVIDGVVVERSRNESQATAGSLQSICWGSQARTALRRLLPQDAADGGAHGPQSGWAVGRRSGACPARTPAAG